MASTSPNVPLPITIEGPGDLVPNFIAANTVLLLLATTAVSFRIWSRKLSNAPLGWDDLLILLAYVFCVGYVGLFGWWIRFGGSKYIGQVTPSKLRQAYLCLFVSEIIYAVSYFFIRASALALWTRLFYHERWIRWYSYAWRVANGLFTLAIIVVVCLQCQPISLFFDPLDSRYISRCHVNIKEFFFAGALIGLFMDIAIIALPLVPCWKLKLNMLAKLMVCGIFASGFFVTIISIIRLTIVLSIDLQDPETGLNPTWVFATTGLWTFIELSAGIVSACLPCIHPALAKITPLALVPAPLRRRPFVPCSLLEEPRGQPEPQEQYSKTKHAVLTNPAPEQCLRKCKFSSRYPGTLGKYDSISVPKHGRIYVTPGMLESLSSTDSFDSLPRPLALTTRVTPAHSPPELPTSGGASEQRPTKADSARDSFAMQWHWSS